MKPKTEDWKDKADVALRRAAKKAREIAIQTGTPLYVMEHGKVVDALRPAKPKKPAGSPKRKA